MPAVAFLNSSFTTTLATAGTALLSLSFVFATTAQEVLGSCIFLFVKHPFDVLDRVDIGTDQLIVKHISLLFTVFKNVTNHKQTQVPNIVLNTLWIQNVSRSEAMRERLSIFVSFDTSLEDVQLLRNEMQAFVADKENCRDFQPEVDIELVGIAEMNKMELNVEIRHKSNWSNETVRAARRSKFMCALVLALRKIPINAPGGGNAALGSADQPSYTVSVSDAEAAASRDAYKKAQDAKRLFPKEPQDPASGNPEKGMSTGADTANPHDSVTVPPLRYRQPPAGENDALTALNTRHPAADTARNPSDVIEPTTPKSVTRTTSIADSLPDLDRTASIDEVRGFLRRESTRGKRKSPKHFGNARLSPTSEAPSPLPSSHQNPKAAPSASKLDYTQTPKFEYDPYTFESPTHQPTKEEHYPSSSAFVQASFQQSKADSPAIQPRMAPVITPLSSAYHPAVPVPPKDIPPSSTLALTTSNSPQSVANPHGAQGPNPSDTLSPISASTSSDDHLQQHRGGSPVRNPFQINALKSQAQGVTPAPRAAVPPPSEVSAGVHHPAVPGSSRFDHGSAMSGSGNGGGYGQVRRPVPGSGNAFARERRGTDAAAGEGVMPPPRGDSLGQPRGPA